MRDLSQLLMSVSSTDVFTKKTSVQLVSLIKTFFGRINGIKILEKDEHIRPDTSMQSLGALNPSFKEIGQIMPGFDNIAFQKYPELEKIHHVHHAGNSSGIVDGSAAILIGSKKFGRIANLKPRAKILATSKVGTDPTIMLTGPIPATEKVLNTAKMKISDVFHLSNFAFVSASF